MIVTFQHLECVNPKGTDLIAVIGRQSDGKVCVLKFTKSNHIFVFVMS